MPAMLVVTASSKLTNLIGLIASARSPCILTRARLGGRGTYSVQQCKLLRIFCGVCNMRLCAHGFSRATSDWHLAEERQSALCSAAEVHVALLHVWRCCRHHRHRPAARRRVRTGVNTAQEVAGIFHSICVRKRRCLPGARRGVCFELVRVETATT